MELEVDRQKLRELLETHLATDELEMPEFLTRMDPGTLKEMVQSGAMGDMLSKLGSATALADWCFLCGASRGPAAEPLPVEKGALSNDLIDTLAKELLGAVKTK